uniref:Uncharacterized protein n=1 Tax=viral metagenome TaxID=1070528 RepID=A0A6C0E3I7_9ZZZZ
MKMNKQIIKKLNSPKMFFIFIFFVIIALIVLHFVFQSIRVIFDMDKKADAKMDTAKLSADNTNTTNTTNNNKTS